MAINSLCILIISPSGKKEKNFFLIYKKNKIINKLLPTYY